MIRNERQVKLAQKKLKDLEHAAEQAVVAEKKVWQRLAAEVRCEIEDYLAIKDGLVDVFEISSIDDLPDAIVKARIAKRLTQAELAERLDVSEQVVQKNEAGGYENAGWARLADVCDVLGYELSGHLRPSGGARLKFSNVTPAVPSEANDRNIMMKMAHTMLTPYSNRMGIWSLPDHPTIPEGKGSK